MSYEIIGNNSVTVDVTDDNELNVNVTSSKTLAGYIALHGDGSRNTFKVSNNNRLKLSFGTPLFSEYFPGTAVNSAIWTAPATTMTITQTPGSVQLNAGLGVATNTRAHLSTKQSFPIYGAYGISINIALSLTQFPVMGNQCEWGVFYWPSYPASTAGAITEGVFWRVSEAGKVFAVVKNNGVEHLSPEFDFSELFSMPHKYTDFEIFIADTVVKFLVNGSVVYTYLSENNQDSAIIGNKNIPVSFRNYNNAATSLAQVMKISRVSVNLLNKLAPKDWRHVLSGAGGCGAQGQTGGTMGSTATYANSANPTATVATNTTAALGTGLGGQVWETPTLAAGTDGIILSYQVPAGTAALPGKTLYIHGVWINSYIQTTLTGGGNNEQWVLAYGHTSVSMATAEAATTKAPRRVPLGTRGVASAATATTQLTPIYRQFTSPVVVQQGEFVALVKKHIGTAASAGAIAHVIGFDAVWE